MAVEAAIQLYPSVKDYLDEIDRIVLTTHESAIRIIDKWHRRRQSRGFALANGGRSLYRFFLAVGQGK